MYTMFQIMTMDSWSSGIGRVIIFEHGYVMASVFFISYIFFAGIVMTNVVVAILLDKYLEAIDKDKQEEKAEKDALAAADAEDLNEDPTEPEVEIYLYNDNKISPLRSLTWHKFREMQHWLSKRDDRDHPPKKSDDE